MTLAEAVYPLDAEVAAAVQARVLARAGGQTLAEFKRSVRRAVHTLDPARVEEHRAHAMTERRVCLSPREDGITELWALLPAEGAAAVMTAIDTLASVTSATDPRTADQRRADALVDLGIAALHDPHLPSSARPAPRCSGHRRRLDPARPRRPTRRTAPDTDPSPHQLARHLAADFTYVPSSSASSTSRSSSTPTPHASSSRRVAAVQRAAVVESRGDHRRPR